LIIVISTFSLALFYSLRSDSHACTGQECAPKF
jgi:hypothetical protein